jgi:GT2 family glycosyltransferase
MSGMNDVGVVVIGRNEGERLERCLDSLAGSGVTIVYVDSGSTDRSVEAAKARGATVVDLDVSGGFSAARARNTGFRKLAEMRPDVAYVQFVDGDCQVAPTWLAAARATHAANPRVAIVCGVLRERRPEDSVYNRMCDREWNRPPGLTDWVGGIFMIRRDAFERAGGFNPSLVAGEEPELCVRLRREGWHLMRLAEPMAWHDAAMRRFGQWWRRNRRNGYWATDAEMRFELGVFSPMLRSARLWTVGVLWAMTLAMICVGVLYGPAWGAAAAACLSLAWPAQTARMAFQSWRGGGGWKDAMRFACLNMIGKWAILQGHIQRQWDGRRAGPGRLIEYKSLAQNPRNR